MRRQPLAEFFATRAERYRTAEGALKHAMELLQRLGEKQPVPEPARQSKVPSAFNMLLVTMAPEFLKNGQYDITAMAIRASEAMGRPVSRMKVSNAISRLKKIGLVPASGPRLFGSYARERTATESDVEPFWA